MDFAYMRVGTADGFEKLVPTMAYGLYHRDVGKRRM